MAEFESRIDLKELNKAAEALRTQVSSVVVGQQKMIDLMLIAILSDGHVLIEGVPGIAKTLTAKLMAKSLSAQFSRIQFTPDLMPSDVIGTSVFNMAKSEFEFKAGPIFSNIVLIDEINRAPAKTQSALFEVMEERQITVDGKTYIMDKPFLVFATQNPIEHEGTYRLPEAQLDRFLFKIEVTYPSLENEILMLNNHHNRNGNVDLSTFETIFDLGQIVQLQQIIQTVQIEANVQKYIAQIVSKTRNNTSIYLGASPRASLAIMTAAKAHAAINGRDFVTPDDVKEIAAPVLVHRIILTPEKEMEGLSNRDIIKQIVEQVEVPR